MSELTIADLRGYVSNREGQWSDDRGMTLAELDALLAAHDKEVLEKAAERIRAAVYEPTGATTDAVNAVWPDHVKQLIEHGVAMMVEAAITEICIAAVRGDEEQATQPRQFGVTHPSDKPVGYVHGTEEFARFCDEAIDARRHRINEEGGSNE